MEIDPEHDMHLMNGELVQLRLLEPRRDTDALCALYAGLSQQSIYFRWFSAGRINLERDIQRMTSIPIDDGGPPQRRAVVGMRRGLLAGVAGWERLADHTQAEVAFVIDEHTHGLGLASLLLEQLAAEASRHGISTFTADVLTANPHMVDVFRGAGFVVTSQTHTGVISLSFDTAATEVTEVIAADREALSSHINARDELSRQSGAGG